MNRLLKNLSKNVVFYEFYCALRCGMWKAGEMVELGVERVVQELFCEQKLGSASRQC